ncbi:DUF5994 family protein [Nonomuraea longicatena]|uniref:Uncharacterized protein n=1 Tax=Nonomuraea longicatena TaxID=83682 RepID=A0ABN1PWZ6_9ACTN
MTPTLLSQRAPLGSVSSALPRADSALRLSLHPVPDRRALVNGAWWPYSCDAAAELPGLIAAVDQRLQRTTLMVGVHRDAWPRIPSRIPARGRTVRIGWFRHADPHVIVLFFASDEPVALLIIPPDTALGAAEAALELTARDTADLTDDAIVALAHLPSDPAHPTTADSTARRGSGCGPVGRQAARRHRRPT